MQTKARIKRLEERSLSYKPEILYIVTSWHSPDGTVRIDDYVSVVQHPKPSYKITYDEYLKIKESDAN